jgi:hypothetical protein
MRLQVDRQQPLKNPSEFTDGASGKGERWKTCHADCVRDPQEECTTFCNDWSNLLADEQVR